MGERRGYLEGWGLIERVSSRCGDYLCEVVGISVDGV